VLPPPIVGSRHRPVPPHTPLQDVTLGRTVLPVHRISLALADPWLSRCPNHPNHAAGLVSAPHRSFGAWTTVEPPTVLPSPRNLWDRVASPEYTESQTDDQDLPGISWGNSARMSSLTLRGQIQTEFGNWVDGPGNYHKIQTNCWALDSKWSLMVGINLLPSTLHPMGTVTETVVP
jgi:hypothetical protein